MDSQRVKLESETGQLFSSLWREYDDVAFKHSIQLFLQRREIIGEDLDVIQGSLALDAGCGGGRNSIGLKLAGAKEVIGVDVGVGGLADARMRTEKLGLSDYIQFHEASIQSLPFENEKFDLVWCAGVLMIVDDESAALDELLRVLKPGGTLFLLVYATGGIRWPLINLLRPLSEEMGIDIMEEAFRVSTETSAARRTFLDDLFCPKLDFYSWDRLYRMLSSRKVSSVTRLGDQVRLDHESSVEDYVQDLARLKRVFDVGFSAGLHPLFSKCSEITNSVLAAIKLMSSINPTNSGKDRIIGQGHHRVLVRK